MKQTMIRTASVVLLLATLLNILPIYGSPQSTLVYSTASNSGLRDQLCTTLDGTGAENYYGNDYSYDLLSELSADQLYDALEELMTDTHKRITTYNECRDLAVKTDCEQNDGRIVLIYTSYSADGMNDYTNNRTGGWNREHIWRHGSMLKPTEVFEQATGEKFDPDVFCDYLEQKFGELYGF